MEAKDAALRALVGVVDPPRDCGNFPDDDGVAAPPSDWQGRGRASACTDVAESSRTNPLGEVTATAAAAAPSRLRPMPPGEVMFDEQ